MSTKPTICVICGESFELKPGKPGFANRCLTCSSPKPLDPVKTRRARKLDNLKLLKAGAKSELKRVTEKKVAAERAGRHPFFIDNLDKSIAKFDRLDKGADLRIARVEESLKVD